MVAVDVSDDVVSVVEFASKPFERLVLLAVKVLLSTASPVMDAFVTTLRMPSAYATLLSPTAPLSAAVAGEVARTPAPRAATATSAMRLRSVFVDMFFLSLVEIGHFPISARRSCEIF
jgi:hypothetical protein